MKLITYHILGLLLILSGCTHQKKEEKKEIIEPIESNSNTFTNPLLPNGPDPYSTYHNGFYYYMSTTGNNLVLKKVKNLANLSSAEVKTIWTPPSGTAYSYNIWAPEIHFIEDKWYVYFAADDGQNKNHRMYVVENTSEDPFSGQFTFKGKITSTTDKWAIDGNVFNYQGQLYMIWSGWEGDQNGQQNIYIAKMISPTQIDGERVKIASPTYDWERVWNKGVSNPNPPEVYVNEGPQFLMHNNTIFIVFSASGCWTDYYSLGLLHFTGEDDLLNAELWEKQSEPLFTQSSENGVYGPGHNSFFTSPDGTEDWILYHANSKPGQGCGSLRSPRMQLIEWDENNFPVLGTPVSENQSLPIPATLN